MNSMMVVQNIPDGSNCVGDRRRRARAGGGACSRCILEGLGYSVYARIVPLHVVGDLLGGTVRLAWRKLRPYIEEERQRGGSQKTFEWFQMARYTIGAIFTGKTSLQIGGRTKPIATGSRDVASASQR